MKGRSKKTSSKKSKTTSKNHNKPQPAKRRGRPKGSKNKPKDLQPTPQTIVAQPVKKRGRPRGSKNKPKSDSTVTAVSVVAISKPTAATEPKSVASKKDTTQPLTDAVCWLLSRMHPNEMQYYRKRANRLELDIEKTMALDLLSFFNVQDQELRKQIKTTLVCNS